MCESVNNDIDYWKHYIKSEVRSAIMDVWEDAQEDISGFLDDWKYVMKIFYLISII